MITIELLAETALRHDSLQLRSLVQDLLRTAPDLSQIPQPQTSDQRTRAVAAALVELLAERSNQPAPAWTHDVGAMPEPTFLIESATRMKRLRTLCETEAPLPLRKRNLYAPPNFLEFV